MTDSISKNPEATVGGEPPANWESLDARGAGALALVKAARSHGATRSAQAAARSRAAVMAELAAGPRGAAVVALGTPPPPAPVWSMGAGEWMRLAAVCAVGFGLGALWVASAGPSVKSTTVAVATAPAGAGVPVEPVAGGSTPMAGPAPEMVLVSGPAPAGMSTSGPAFEARQFILLQQLQVGALIENDASEMARLQSLERNLIPDPASAKSLSASERQAVAAYREGEAALGALRADAAREHFVAARRVAPGTTTACLALLRLASIEIAADGDAAAARASYAQALKEYDRVVAAAEWRPALAELAGE